jgi:hypothetical protein
MYMYMYMYMYTVQYITCRFPGIPVECHTLGD